MGSWGSLPRGRRPTKQEANEFLLASAFDYQQRALVWDTVRKLVREDLRNPGDLWGTIVRRHRSDWRAWDRLARRLHRFPKARERLVNRIAPIMVDRFAGDARRLWNRSTSPYEVTYTLASELRLGPQLSRMVTGGLIDCEQIPPGRADVKGDSNITRVLSRVFGLDDLSSEDAVAVARVLHPVCAWRLDRSLFQVGTEWCLEGSAPRCADCYLRRVCDFAE